LVGWGKKEDHSQADAAISSQAVLEE